MSGISEQPGREWQNGIFGCFGDIRLCVFGFCIPCYVMGKNAEKLGEDCLLVGLLGCVGLQFGPVLRWRIRQEKGIRGSMIMDAAFYACIPCCALIQEARELEDNPPVGGAAGGKYAQEAPQSMARN